MDMPDVLKKDVWKVNIVLHVWLELNDHSKCLMSASTALQTNLKHLFSEDIHKLSLFSVRALISWSLMRELTIPPILFEENPWKSLVAIRAIMIKTTTDKSFWASLRVTAAT